MSCPSFDTVFLLLLLIVILIVPLLIVLLVLILIVLIIVLLPPKVESIDIKPKPTPRSAKVNTPNPNYVVCTRCKKKWKAGIEAFCGECGSKLA